MSEESNFAYQSQEKGQTKENKKSSFQYNSAAATQAKTCKKCNCSNEEHAHFCEECGASLEGCPKCGADIPHGAELCPVCKFYLIKDKCSFCGAHKDPNDTFCAECGNPTDGIICPDCHSLNFRNFCHKCNKPLTDAGFKEVENATKDEVFQEIQQEAQHLEKIETNIDQFQDFIQSPDFDVPDSINPVASDLLNKYTSLLNNISSGKTKIQEESGPPKIARRELKQIAVKDAKEQEGLYKDKLKEMQDLMDQLKPLEGSTPIVQRDYYSARKVKVVKSKRAVVSWVCNLCGHTHNHPSECAQPEMGGHWVYETIEDYTYDYE